MKTFISIKPTWGHLLIALVCFCTLSCSELNDTSEPALTEQEEASQILSEEDIENLSDAFAAVLGEADKVNATADRRFSLSTYDLLVRVNRLTGEFSTLLAGIESAGLIEALDQETAITLFTPPDAAFAQIGLDENSIRDLDRDVLQNILLYHGTEGKRRTVSLLYEQRIRMLNQDFAVITREGRKLLINQAQLLAPFLVNISTRNGVIHIITQVLDPSDSPTSLPPLVTGLAYAKTKKGVNGSFDALDGILESNPNINVVARIDHAANAANVGKELRPTKLMIFGNPNLGTPLMQINQTIGIDLPQKVLFYQNEKDEVFATYNTSDYLASRHGIPKDAATFPAIGNALKNLVGNATEGDVLSPASEQVRARAGLVIKKSAFSADETFERLVAAVEAVGPLRIIAQIDHAANADKVDLELRPTKLLIFGNPNLGTPLMQKAQTIGIDLPQKMLVWQAKNGQVYLAYNDPYYLAKRHKISDNVPELGAIAGALANLAGQATLP